MVDFHEFPLAENPATRIWITRGARKDLDRLASESLLSKLEQCSERGFSLYTGEWPLAREPNGTWGFGIRSLNVRLAGFFEDEQLRTDFFVEAVFRKRGKSNTAGENEIYKAVGQTKKSGDYTRIA